MNRTKYYSCKTKMNHTNRTQTIGVKVRLVDRLKSKHIYMIVDKEVRALF